MKKRWYRRFLIMVLLFGLFVGGGFSIRNAKQMYSKEEVSAKAASGDLLIPGGMPIGIYMETDGVMVLGTEALEGLDGLDVYKRQDRGTGSRRQECRTSCFQRSVGFYL